MRSADIFLLAVAALIGFYTITLEPWSSQWWLAVSVAAAVAILALMHAALGRSIRINMWLPWALIISGPLVGGAWLYFNYIDSQKTYPGISVYTVLRIFDQPVPQRKYIWDVGEKEGKARAALYLSASDKFTFAVTDAGGEVYPLEVRIGNKGIPVDRIIFLLCEAGIDKNSTFLRVFVDGKNVAERTLGFPLNLGKKTWPGIQTSLGASAAGKEFGVFNFFEGGIRGQTIAKSDIEKLTEYNEKTYNLRGQ